MCRADGDSAAALTLCGIPRKLAEQVLKYYTQSCHKFCPKFHVVRSWRQWGVRIQRLVIFGLLILQGLVPRQFAHVWHSVNMEWGFKVARVPVTDLQKCGKWDSQIFKLLKTLKISRNFVYLAIRRYKGLWGVEDRVRLGRPKSVRAEGAIKIVRSGFAEIRSGNRTSCPESWT